MTAFVGFPQDGHSFSANEVGQALAGLIARDNAGVPRVGMLGDGPTVTAVAASWRVQVDRFVYVHQIAGAVQFSGLSAAEQVDIVPAVGDVPAGQARIDLVCWNPVSAALVVLKGTPAVSPVAPAAGALAPVERVRVNAGDGMVVQAQLAAAFEHAALAQSASSRQFGVLAHMAGGTSLSGQMFTSATFAVAFPTPFDDVPYLQVTSQASNSSTAQWAQPFNVTKSGFQFRIVSVNAAPVTGSISWEAEPR